MAKITDQDDRFVRLKSFELATEYLRFTATQHAEYGRWMIATLSVIHSGAIFLIATSDMPPNQQYWFVLLSCVGLLCALCSGWAAWWNWALFRDFWGGRLVPQALVDDAFPLPAGPASTKFMISYWLAVALSVLSILVILIETAAFAIHG